MLGVDVSPATLYRWFMPSIRWLEPAFIFVLVATALLVAYLLRCNDQFNILIIGLTNSAIVSYAIYVIAPLSFITFWSIGVYIYLRLGNGPKLGLVYEAFDVEEPHVQKVKQILRELHNSGEMRHRTSLRFLPRRALANPQSIDRYIRRYNFSMIAHIGQTKTLDSNRPHFEVKFHMKWKNTDIQVIDKMIRAYLVRQQVSNTKPISVLDLLKKSAATLNDLMLTLLALQKLMNNELPDAAALLRRIEDLTPESLDPTKPPRAPIRELDAVARLRPLQFSITDMPSPDILRDMLTKAETANRYATQFSWVAYTIARLRFLNGDNVGALSIIEENIQSIPSAKRNPFILLAKAFLEFHSYRWHNSYDCYIRLLDNPNLFDIQWQHDLVPFADYVASIEMEGAQILQVLYARLANCGVTSKIETEAFAWIEADITRSCFRDLLQRAPEVWSACHSSTSESSSKQEKSRPPVKSKQSKKTRRKRKKPRK